MRRGLLTFVLLVLGLYFALHLALGSSPVQARVLSELRAVLAKYGFDLEMESIEFSAFSPKIYLNRVTLTARPKALISLPEPLAIDKIKIQFQPLALIYRQISIDELTLFHPRILIPDASVLYRRAQALLGGKKGMKLDSGAFSVVFRKVGVVDALLSVEASDPKFAFRTRSLSAFLQNNSSDQQAITVESNNIEIERGPLRLALKRVDVDVDATKRSVRINRAILEGDPFSLNVRGVTSLPLSAGKPPESASLSYELRLALPFVNELDKLRRFEKGVPAVPAMPPKPMPEMHGKVVSSGNLRRQSGVLSGEGTLEYSGLNVDGNRIGGADLRFSLANEKLHLADSIFHYAGGEVKAPRVTIGLGGAFPLSGELHFSGVALQGILESVKVTPAPVRMGMNGTMKVSGQLADPFEIRAETEADVHNLIVLQHPSQPLTPENTVLTVAKGGVTGLLTFTLDRFRFDTSLKVLGSEMKTEGYVGFGELDTIVKVRSEGTSLTELGRISDLRLAGIASIAAEVNVVGTDAKVAGTFDVQGGEISDVVLGPVKGEVFYQNDLLSFENVEIPSIEPIHGSGFVDFKPVKTHYKFTGDGHRIETNQVFNVFQKLKLSFQAPSGGETAARFTIEGGHDAHGMEVTASGQAKDIAWYGEHWTAAHYNFRYRLDDVDLSRLLLMKKNGAVEVKAGFKKKAAEISFYSRGLRLEELDTLRGSLVQGEIIGEVAFHGDGESLFSHGDGELRLTKTAFRGNPLPDTQLSLHTVGKDLELVGRVAGDRLRGRLLRGADGDDLTLSFSGFDFLPFVTLGMAKDVPSITQLTASGAWQIRGKLADFSSLRGSGQFTQLELGFKGTPMRNRQPVEMKLDNGKVRVPRFQLEGADSQLAMEVAYEPSTKVQASIDARLDLQMLQPFIPGLEYGTGKVSAGVRISGVPQQFELIGNATLDDAAFRLTGLLDEFRSTRGQFSISHERINFDKFETSVNGGSFNVEGDIRLNRFKSFIPNLTLHADRVALKFRPSLVTRFSGDFNLRGVQMPYLLSGNCIISEGNLTEFGSATRAPAALDDSPPVLRFDINCEAKDHLFVNTDMMVAEYKGTFHLLGNTDQIGLLGGAEALRGTLIFKDTRFNLTSGNVKFESPTAVAPRFSVSGQARVREQKLSRISVANSEATDRPNEYEVTLLVYGTPTDYKIRLSSSPGLPEPDIISLLVLGVTSRGQEGNYVDLGSALVGQIPLQSKLQNEFGLDIRLKSQAPSEYQQLSAQDAASKNGSSPSGRTDITVPSVQIQKQLTKKTRVSFSNTLEANPARELKLEQILDENLSVNATVDSSPLDPNSAASQGYGFGMDFRYRFNFQ